MKDLSRAYDEILLDRLRMRDAGINPYQIAKAQGVNPPAIRRWFARFDTDCAAAQA